jgi:hypothetical protein
MPENGVWEGFSHSLMRFQASKRQTGSNTENGVLSGLPTIHPELKKPNVGPFRGNSQLGILGTEAAIRGDDVIGFRVLVEVLKGSGREIAEASARTPMTSSDLFVSNRGSMRGYLSKLCRPGMVRLSIPLADGCSSKAAMRERAHSM